MPEPPPATLAGALRPYNHRRHLGLEQLEVFIQLLKEADVSMSHSSSNLLIDPLKSRDCVDFQQYLEVIVQGNCCFKGKKPVHRLLVTLASEWTQNSWTIDKSSHDLNKLVPLLEAFLHLVHADFCNINVFHNILVCVIVSLVENRDLDVWRYDNIKLPVAYFPRILLYTLQLVKAIKRKQCQTLEMKGFDAANSGNYTNVKVHSLLVGVSSGRISLGKAYTIEELLKVIFPASKQGVDWLMHFAFFLHSEGVKLLPKLDESYSSRTIASSNLEPESTVCHEDEALFGDLFCEGWRSVGSMDKYDQSALSASSLTHAKAKEITSIQAEVRFEGIRTARVFFSFIGQCGAIYVSLSDGFEGVDYRKSGSGGGSKRRKDDGETGHAYEDAEPLTGKKPRLTEPDKLTNLFAGLEMQPLPRTVRGTLLERVARTELKVRSIEGDGNCQFRSVSKVLSGTQKHYPEARKKVVEEMTNNSQLYMDYGSSLNVRGWRMSSKIWFDKYVRKMAKDKHWGDYVTLFAAANVWQVRVILYCSHRDVAVKEFVPLNRKSFKDIYLCYTYLNNHNAHYEAMMSDQDIHALNATPSPKRNPVHVPFEVVVKNIPHSWDSDKLRNIFDQCCGGVIRARVIYKDGKSRGFGFVELVDEHVVGKAISMTRKLWLGRTFTVKKDMTNLHDREADAGL